MAADDDTRNFLKQFGKVVNDELPDVEQAFHRDAEVDMLVNHLDRARNPSFLLVGPSGCGKSAILREFFRRIIFRDENEWVVLQTSTSEMMAGTVYLGEWQTRVKGMLDRATRADRVAIYFSDVPNMIGAGRHSKSDENMAAMFASFLERGDVVVFGECTEEQYRTLDKHASFKRQFTQFGVETQPPEVCRNVMKRVADALTRRAFVDHDLDVSFSATAVTAAEEFGRVYFPGMAPPGGAVRLLELAVNRVVDEARERPRRDIAISYDELVRTLQGVTGIPSRLLDDSQSLSVAEVRQFFESRVIGQPAAVSSVVDLITLIKAGLTDPSKPLGVLFFVGPTGVGKTELAKSLAEFIFGSAERMIRLDMSEYKDFHSFEKIIGNPAREEFQQATTLLGRVRQQPFSVILLDEIEKAHDNIFDLLLQLFDDGRLSDASGRTTNFTQTIIILTSNLGSDLNTTSFGFRSEEAAPTEQAQQALEGYFRPEFINRIDRVVRFVPLEREHVRIIAQRELGQVLLRSGITRRELRVDVDSGVIDILVEEGFSPIYGARPLKRAVERLALLPIAREIVHMVGEYRNALLRLIPGRNRVHVKIVRDRTTRKTESMAKGVTVVDPLLGKKVKLRPDDIEAELLKLQAAMGGIEAVCAAQNLVERKSDIVARTNRVDFWDDQRQARDLLSEAYRIERLLETVAGVRKRVDDVAEQHRQAIAKADPEHLASVAERIRDVAQHAELVEFSLQCRDEIDRSDAFVSLSVLPWEDETDDDPLSQFADMYTHWARRKGFEVRTVHEEMFHPKRTKQLVLLIEGVAVFGVLSSEEGMHELVYGKTSKLDKFTQYVKVRILPVVEDLELGTGEVTVKSRKAKGNGKRCKKLKTQTTLTHGPTAITVETTNDLDAEQAQDLARELLRAEVYRRRQQRLAQSLASAEAARLNGAVATDAADAVEGDGDARYEEVIRKYVLRPSTSAKDARTGVVTHNLAELWKGDLDEFLHAALQHRQKPGQPGG